MDEAMKLKKRMVSIFKRNGREGQYVRLFDQLDQWQKDYLQKYHYEVTKSR